MRIRISQPAPPLGVSQVASPSASLVSTFPAQGAHQVILISGVVNVPVNAGEACLTNTPVPVPAYSAAVKCL